jgi:pimeloyl-ACP methyl ester carboxylesterase
VAVHRFTTREGLRLAADVHAEGGRGPVLLLHGGGQTRHAWAATSRALRKRGWDTIALDQRGHGDSDWAPDGEYGVDAFAGDLADVVAAIERPPVLVGASLGGIASLLALGADPPPAAAGLILVDVAHRFEPSGAQRVVDFMREHPEGFETPTEAAEAVARYLPHRVRPTNPRGIKRNLRLRDGRWCWHWDPALVHGTQTLSESRSAELSARIHRSAGGLRIPTLLIRGGSSDVVSTSIAREFAELVPHADVVEVDRAAHMVAGDANDHFRAAVTAFLEDLERGVDEAA